MFFYWKSRLNLRLLISEPRLDLTSAIDCCILVIRVFCCSKIAFYFIDSFLRILDIDFELFDRAADMFDCLQFSSSDPSSVFFLNS
jgi:hypothetical protein